MAGDEAGGRDAEAIIESFARWAADDRARAAAAARTSERWLRQQDAEAATVAGTLVDLAEAGSEVTLIVGSRRLAGRLVGVASELCVIEARSGVASVVATTHLTAVVPAAGTGRGHRDGPATGGRGAAMTTTLVDALAGFTAEGAPVRLWLAGGETLTGELIATGVDVVTLRLQTGTGTRARAYAPVRAIEAITPL
jgi:hypothetical protein